MPVTKHQSRDVEALFDGGDNDLSLASMLINQRAEPGSSTAAAQPWAQQQQQQLDVSYTPAPAAKLTPPPQPRMLTAADLEAQLGMTPPGGQQQQQPMAPPLRMMTAADLEAQMLNEAQQQHVGMQQQQLQQLMQQQMQQHMGMQPPTDGPFQFSMPPLHGSPGSSPMHPQQQQQQRPFPPTFPSPPPPGRMGGCGGGVDIMRQQQQVADPQGGPPEGAQVRALHKGGLGG